MPEARYFSMPSMELGAEVGGDRRRVADDGD